MHAHPIPLSVAPRCNRSRVASLAAALGLNLFALLLLARPGEVPVQAAPLVAVGIRWIEPPPVPPVVPVPPEPVPAARMRPRPRAEPIAVPSTVDTVETPVARPDDAAVADLAPVAVPDAVSAVDAVGTVAGADAALAYTRVVTPRYPRDALQRGEHGTVLLRVEVGSDGLPIRIAVARSSGSPRLDRAAIEAVRQWRFRALEVDGVKRPSSGLVPVAFHLDRA